MRSIKFNKAVTSLGLKKKQSFLVGGATGKTNKIFYIVGNKVKKLQ